MSKKPHILFITYGYPKNLEDIKYSFFREQAESLSEYGIKVGVLSSKLISFLKPFKTSFLPKVDYKSENNINVIRCSWNKWIPFSERYKIKLLRYISSLGFKEYIKKNGLPDLIHNHSLVYSGFISEYLSDKYKIPFLITEHNSGFHYGKYNSLLNDISRICNKSSLCLAVSSNLGLLLNKKIKDSPKWQTHHNLVSKKFYQEEIKQIDTKQFTFIGIGNLIIEKNFSLLIRSFNNFNKIYPNSCLKIIGVGSEYDKLVSISNKLNILSKVSFLGSLSRNKIIKTINNSHVFVCSSNYETFGIVSAESLSLGKVVISTQNSGSFDVLNKSVALILENNNVDDMTNAMINVYKNYKNYDPFLIREYSINKFSDEIITKNLISKYFQILNKK
jgi:glycosyltransferase involved in cell wall biosynthesis